MKIVLDNIIFWLQKSGGGSVYWSELIRRFNESAENCIFYDHEEGSANFLRQELKLRNTKKEKALTLKLRRYLPFTEKISTKAIFHSSYYRYSSSKYAINCTTIHDFTTEKFRDGLARWVNLQQKKYAVKNSKGIICISENTKKDLLHYFPEAASKNIAVIYNGISKDYYKIDADYDIELMDDRFKNLRNFGYVLYVGHRTNYKNFDIAVKGMVDCIDKYTFVIIGESLTDSEKSTVEKYIGNRYIVVSKLTNKGLNLLYNKAFALLYPSSYEGFGIPIVEAMRTYCPVVANNNSSIPEVAGDGAILIKDIKPNDISEAIRRLEDPFFRKELTNKGFLQSQKFDWDKTADQYLEFYKKLFNE